MQDLFATSIRVGQTLRYLATIAATIAEAATEAIAVISLDGTVHYANEAWARMHGYQTKAELIGKKISAFHTKQMEAEVLGLIEEAAHRGQLSGPVEHIRSDGTTLPTETVMIKLKNGQDEPLGLVVFASETGKHNRTKLAYPRPRLQPCPESAESASAKERLQREIAEHKDSQHRLVQQIGKLAATNRQLRQEIAELKREQIEVLEEIVEADPPEQQIPGWNPQELKALSELARRLR
jgi:PAS domain S-box-containing protein